MNTHRSLGRLDNRQEAIATQFSSPPIQQAWSWQDRPRVLCPRVKHVFLPPLFPPLRTPNLKVETDNGILVQIEQWSVKVNRIIRHPTPASSGSSKPIALSLELPEETLVEKHRKHSFDRPGPTTGMVIYS
ncbi:hypothetical protein BU15DRAFT_63304 [Melanogaster broomeanus]|nr:hypothetical protein BU15DRAFT_63304 [Melanogaster broomeanus]